jgi:hypothetical protein
MISLKQHDQQPLHLVRIFQYTQACEKLRIIPAQNRKLPKMDILEITVDKLQEAIISE